MIGEPESPESTENPLAGVLDRLLRREHGEGVAPPTRAGPRRRSSDSARTAEEVVPHARRMLAVAGLGADRGIAAVRSATQWAVVLGRRPSITDLACDDPEVAELGEEGRTPGVENRVPLARFPCGLDRIRHEPADVAIALLRRLRRHESASDFVIVRVPASDRLSLMRAAFLSGAIVVPVDESDAGLGEALEITREVLRNFLEVSVWPLSSSARCMERYLELVRGSDDVRVAPFDPGQRDLAAAFERLRDPPREGFLVGLLAPEPASLSAELLRIDFLVL